jgi:anti-sigma regulatory factor (Ser/Thr protein kinase)
MRSGAKTLSLTFRAEPDSVPSARTALGDFALQAGAESRQVDAVRLASSEALTNAVLHAYRTEPGSVYVTAAVVAEELWVLVADDGCGLEPRAGRPGLGLGLGLIAQLSDELAIVPRASGGTEVRMRFNLVRAESSGPESSSDSESLDRESRESGGGPDAFRARPSLA